VGTIKDGSENWDVKAMINMPLVKDVLALRVVGSYVHQGGWIDDLRPTTANVTENLGTDKVLKDQNWTNYKTVRASLLWNAAPTLTITPSIIYQDAFSNTDRTFSDITFGLRAREKARYLDTYSKDKFVIGTMVVKNDFDALGGFSLLSSSSYMDRRTHLFYDVTAFDTSAVSDIVGPAPGGKLYPTPLQDITHTKQFTQEVRMVSTGSSRLQYVIGGFYRHMNQDYNRNISVANLFGVPAPLPLGASNPPVLEDTKSKFKESEIAAFGELTYAVFDHFKVAAGARVFSYKQKETARRYGVGGPVGGALDYAYAEMNKEHGVTPRFTLSYEPTRELSLYASYAQGFRTGGVNAPITDDICTPAERQEQNLPDVPPPYKSDKTDNFEVGAKTNFMGGKLRINGAAYSIKWKDFQQAFQTTCGSGNENSVSFIVNAGKVRSNGGELEVVLNPVEGLNLQAGASYTDATYRNAVPQLLLAAGSRVLDVPKWTWNARADYSVPLTGSLTGNFFFAARHVGGSDSGFGEGEVLQRPAYTLLDLSIGISTAQKLSVDFFINNITDAIPVYGAEFATSPDNTTATSYFSYHVGPPRTIGVRVSKAF
jgi:outer membrane receptor protein involved in Fe transport